MLDLIPSLLSQLTTQKVALDNVQPTGTELVFQQEVAPPAQIATIAPPESSSERLPPVPVRPTVAATPAPLIQTSNIAASSTIQRPGVVSQSTTPPSSPQQTEPVFEVVVNREAPALAKPAPVSGAAIANSPTNAVLPIVKSSIQNSATLTTNPSTQPKPPLQSGSSNRSNQLLERRQFLKQRLAEIVAKDTAKKVAQESVVTRAYESVSKGNFDQARQLLQDPTLSAAVRADLVNAINSLEAKSRKVGVAQATEPVRIAVNQRQLSQRQQDLLRSVPSLPPLPTSPPSQVSVDRGFKSVPIAIQRLPQPLSDRQAAVANSADLASSDSSGLRPANQDYSTVNPAAPDLQAYRGTVPIPNNLTSEQIMYPLPVPALITSKYGWRVHPVKGDRRFHAGVDLGAAQGTPILATRIGRVAIADRMGGYGLAVVLQHAQGKQDTLYAHMSQMFVRPGEQVKPGTIIGRVGSTGLSTGPHLHYETRQQKGSSWVTTDPGPQLEVARSQLVQARKVNAKKVEQQG
ncbi:MAG: peptidoglycan DD-metalloendopeptidase family protein [Phormidesmis sp. CAN_BIN36]|nr:peptidoglycan DD-metalloendopeptidase family protein [Phormidesmis sp. CAN_BIN36]